MSYVILICHKMFNITKIAPNPDFPIYIHKPLLQKLVKNCIIVILTKITNFISILSVLVVS